MAQLISLALETHPRIGACFVVRFSWNSRAEDPLVKVKSIPVAEREYDPAARSWRIAARHVDLLASLFTNWQEQAAALAAARKEEFAAVMVGVLCDEILGSVESVMQAASVISGDALLEAMGSALGAWLDEWRAAAPDAAAALDRSAGRVEQMARDTRTRLPSWGLRAAFVRELLAPEDGRP